MNNSLITVRYVKALYQLSEEKGIQDTVKKDIELLLDCIINSAELREFLENPILKSSEKNTLINDLFKKSIHDLTLRFLHLLVENKRETHLHNICYYFIRYYKENKGIKEAEIITANQLLPSHKDEILKYITKKFKVSIELEEKVNPSIIGGFILRIEDQQINASLRAQLNKIKRELINS